MKCNYSSSINDFVLGTCRRNINHGEIISNQMLMWVCGKLITN